MKDNPSFGCPVHALQDSLQDNNVIPRWDERIRVCVYIEKLNQNASNVDLILNLQTGHISPQFYVVHDDNFEMIDFLMEGVELTR